MIRRETSDKAESAKEMLNFSGNSSGAISVFLITSGKSSSMKIEIFYHCDFIALSLLNEINFQFLMP